MVVDSEPEPCVSPALDAERGILERSAVQPEISVPRDDGPLTLSQLSPRKPDAIADGDAHADANAANGHGRRAREGAISPMRPSVKRPSSAASASGEHELWVRSKKRASGAPAAVAAPGESGMRGVRGRSGRGGARVVSAPVQVRSRPPARRPHEAPTVAVGQRAASTSTRARITNAPRAPPKFKGFASAATSAADSSSSSSATNAGTGTEVSLQPFGAHQEDGGAQQPKPKPYRIPDFKALHASLAAQHSLRRSQLALAPTVPKPIAFSTDARARERGVFDERVREREREEDQRRELLRREREEEEAREVKEARKRAVPRAHEVPEWYKEAPRRGQGGGQ
ncbi:hypothetical protein B0H14DRAFT_414832 [Mycena olivaceomarginata]|nr:hypothetical protein B0H14DRAFT_414832 [Mycena olivaceomarginata]